jgi:hypothetical protein
MMRTTLLAIAAALAATAAYAASAGFIGNTIVSETAGFGELSFYVDPDGSYETSNGDTGEWSYDGSTLCFDDLCGPFDGSKKPGDSWSAPAWDGNGMARLSIEAGNAL